MRGPDGSECRRIAASALLRLAVDPYLAEAPLQEVDPDSHMREVAQGRGRSLRSFAVGELAEAFAGAGGDRRRFELALRASRPDLAWTSPPVERAVDRVHRALARLDDLNFNVTWSHRYEGEGWMLDVRSAWYPTQGAVHLFVVGTSDCTEGVKSAILNLSGPFQAGAARLQETTFEVRCCETRLSGEWTDAGEASSFRGGASLVASSLSMKITGRDVEGRLVQSLGGPSLRGKIVYLLSGRVDGERLEGTFLATGDAATMERLLGRAVPTLGGTWSGRLTGGVAQGTLSSEEGTEVPWKAQVVSTGD